MDKDSAAYRILQEDGLALLKTDFDRIDGPQIVRFETPDELERLARRAGDLADALEFVSALPLRDSQILDSRGHSALLWAIEATMRVEILINPERRQSRIFTGVTVQAPSWKGTACILAIITCVNSVLSSRHWWLISELAPAKHSLNDHVDNLIERYLEVEFPLQEDTVKWLGKSSHLLLEVADDLRHRPLPIVQDSVAGEALTAGQVAIVEAIRNAGRRLVTREVLDAISSDDGVASEGTTKNYLAELTRRKVLNNRTDGRGKGYGLPEWS